MKLLRLDEYDENTSPTRQTSREGTAHQSASPTRNRGSDLQESERPSPSLGRRAGVLARLRIRVLDALGTIALAPLLAAIYCLSGAAIRVLEGLRSLFRGFQQRRRQCPAEPPFLVTRSVSEARASRVLPPRPVSIDDLLGREPVKLDLESIRKWIDHRVLLVTGSAGSIGSEICRQLLRFSPERLVLVDRAETPQFFLRREVSELNPDMPVDVCLADVLDAPRMRQIFRQHRPHVVFHAAAYKHVPLMEECPGEAVKNIVLATRGLAHLAIQHRAQSFVMISTDKAVNPASVMGTCKRIAELYLQSLKGRSGCGFVTVRFGNVLDSAGSVVPIFREQIARGGPVTVTHPKMQRYFMTIPEAARLVIQAGAIGQDGQILALDMGEPVRIVELATDMIRLSGFEPGRDIEIDFTGLRPGEKLSEELLNDCENLLPTSHPKISLAEHCQCDHVALSRAVRELEQLACHAPETLLARLRRMVPECGHGAVDRPTTRSGRAAA